MLFILGFDAELLNAVKLLSVPNLDCALLIHRYNLGGSFDDHNADKR